MISEKITAIVAEQFAVPAESLSAATEFVDGLGADSLDIVELTMSIEEEYGLSEMPEEELRKIVTLGDLIDYVEKALGE